MALSISSIIHRSVFGNKRTVTFEVAFDSSYPTGGEPLTPTDLGMSGIDLILSSGSNGLWYEYDYTNKKLIAREIGIRTGSTGATTSGSGALGENVLGAETAARLANTAVDTTYGFGAMKEVANTTNLSTITGVRLMAIGF